MTVAVPVSVATLPIGSSEAADAGEAGEGVGEGEGDAAGRAGGAGSGKGVGGGAGWVCANFVVPAFSSTAGGATASSMATAAA